LLFLMKPLIRCIANRVRIAMSEMPMLHE